MPDNAEIREITARIERIQEQLRAEQLDRELRERTIQYWQDQINRQIENQILFGTSAQPVEWPHVDTSHVIAYDERPGITNELITEAYVPISPERIGVTEEMLDAAVPAYDRMAYQLRDGRMISLEIFKKFKDYFDEERKWNAKKVDPENLGRYDHTLFPDSVKCGCGGLRDCPQKLAQNTQ